MSSKYKVVSAPDARRDLFYGLTKSIVKKMNIKQSLVGTKEEVLARAAKMNKKRSFQIIPNDSKAHYTDHLIV